MRYSFKRVDCIRRLAHTAFLRKKTFQRLQGFWQFQPAVRINDQGFWQFASTTRSTNLQSPIQLPCSVSNPQQRRSCGCLALANPARTAHQTSCRHSRTGWPRPHHWFPAISCLTIMRWRMMFHLKKKKVLWVRTLRVRASEILSRSCGPTAALGAIGRTSLIFLALLLLNAWWLQRRQRTLI